MSRTFGEELKFQLRSGSILTKLLLINIIVFLISSIIILAMFFNKVPYELAGFKYLMQVAPNADMHHNLTHPWGILLYMFLHIGFWHIVFNMLMYYFSGQIFIARLDEKRFLTTYIFGGLAGLILYITCYNIFPVFENDLGFPICGASASIMAILVALAFYLPNLEVYLFGAIRVKLLYIALFLTVIDLLSIPKGNPGGRIAHLGGALYGAYASGTFRKPKHFLNRVNLLKIFNVFSFKRKPRLEVVHTRPVSDHVYNESKIEKQKRVDRILDKINKSGYESLTKEEKDFLFNASKNV